MPGFDRSGPMGAGSMTDGRRGFCNPANTRNEGRSTGALGFGRGMGSGRGFRGGIGAGMGRGFGRRGWNQRGYYPAHPEYAEEDLNILKAESESVKNTLDMINRRIAEMEKSSK